MNCPECGSEKISEYWVAYYRVPLGYREVGRETPIQAGDVPPRRLFQNSEPQGDYRCYICGCEWGGRYGTIIQHGDTWKRSTE